MITPKPCPFCGRVDLYLGHAFATAMEVACNNCGAHMIVKYPDYLTGNQTMKTLDADLLETAIRRWNMRA
jgi:Lar family restriction alleviation protein